MSEPLRVLMVEDAEDDARLLLRELRRGGFEPQSQRVETPEAMRSALENGIWDVVTSDYVMPRFSGPAALKVLQASGSDLPFIIVSGQVGEETAVECMKAGAHDFIAKENLRRLVPAVRREIVDAQARRERLLAEALLRESDARFRTLARLSPVGIFHADARGGYIYVNERWSAMSGLGAQQAAGRGWEAALHPEDRERASQAWYACAAEKRPFALEYRFRRPDGSVTWVLGRAEGEPGDSGEIAGYVGAVTDITERKAAEEAMQRQLDELRRFQRVSVDRELRLIELEEEIARLKRTRAP